MRDTGIASVSECSIPSLPSTLPNRDQPRARSSTRRTTTPTSVEQPPNHHASPLATVLPLALHHSGGLAVTSCPGTFAPRCFARPPGCADLNPSDKNTREPSSSLAPHAGPRPLAAHRTTAASADLLAPSNPRDGLARDRCAKWHCRHSPTCTRWPRAGCFQQWRQRPVGITNRYTLRQAQT